MGARVLIALGEGAEAAAAALRDAGHTVEQTSWSRLASSVAGTAPALCVVEVPSALAAAPTWALAPDAPGWIALSTDAQRLAAALQAGAQAALPAPVADDLLAATVEQALVRRRRDLELALARRTRALEDEWILAGSSAAARRLAEALARVASTPRTTVLVRGPLGSRPDVLARLVHARSARAAGPLVELQAARVEAGRWAQVLGDSGAPGSAEGGTLIVHEVAGLDEQGQALLALFLDSRGEGAAARSGEQGLRLVATSTRDLSAEVESGRLREDLFYRLNVLALVLPSLEERREDLAALAGHCAARAALALGRSAHGLPADLGADLTRRAWPGELRELDLYMESLALLGAAGPQPAALPALPSERGTTARNPAAALAAPQNLSVGDRRLKSVEEALIRRVLEETGGNKLRAAEILGIHRTTLYHKLEAYGLGR